MKIASLEDDLDQARRIQQVLTTAGYTCTSYQQSRDLLAALRTEHFDLVLLDWHLPDIDGDDVVRWLRTNMGPRIPVIFLTNRSSEDDLVEGLRAGADDYIVKPFKPKELVARVRARLRRTEQEPAEVLNIGDITIDVPAHKVTRGDEAISLTPLEFDLLVALARKPRQVFTREVLLEQVWGYRHAADTRLVNVHVQRLRAKVEKDPENPEAVLTVRGVGYKAGPP